MAELAQGDVYAPGGNQNKTIQLWKTLLDWLSFLFQILLQILKGMPSRARLGNVSYLWSSFSSSADFKPLPVEYSAIAPPPPQISLSTVAEAPEKLVIVLDLDETLVCAYETSSLPAAIRNQATEAGLNWFEIECVTVDKEGEGIQKVNQVTVFERPGLEEFLQRTSEFADLILFTAGLEGYARPLVDRIDARNRFSRRLYRPSTVSTEHRDHVKDLSCLTNDFRRVVLVDNNPFSFLLQPLNGIPCVPFAAGQPHDEQLMEVILPLLEHLSLQEDVRPVLYERFHMPEWFEKHGIPSCIQSPS
ncbi:haloacid dehalogenase-like hydrolase (HAD) superfamily protein [Wolffia australiana]